MSGDAETLAEGFYFLRRLTSAWECCATCAGGVLAAHNAAIRADHERAILQGFIERMPATGEAPDYIHALSTAALALRAARTPTEGES